MFASSSAYSLLWLSLLNDIGSTIAAAPGKATFVASPVFPTSVFASYHFLPSSPTQQPQPAIWDPILNLTYPSNLTNPFHLPPAQNDPIYLPEPLDHLPPAAQQDFLNEITELVYLIIKSDNYTSICNQCTDALLAGQPAARAIPALVPDALTALCNTYKQANPRSCSEWYSNKTIGAVWTQVLAYANVEGEDGKHICHSLGFCPQPRITKLNMTDLFPKPKPKNPIIPKASGIRAKVAHLSDFHLDPRYLVGSEANCTSYMCCRLYSRNREVRASKVRKVLLPAPYFGSWRCDTPYSLGAAALQSIGPLTGTTEKNPLAFTIYTGDLVAHDPHSDLSRDFITYTETSVYGLFKQFLKSPVYVTLGNHDSSPEAIDAPHKMPGRLSKQQSWNYRHVTGLWKHHDWISAEDAHAAETHYAGYSVKTAIGLRVISFNSDFWYTRNWLNMINSTNADNSGVFRWLINELQASEDARERVWIIGHVPSGWDGTHTLPNPSNLFYQIVERYSPHVISGIFFGHTHEDQFTVFYGNNATVQNTDNALMTAWIAPSITPLVNLNPGYRLYEIDTGDFSIFEAYTFYSNVSSYEDLDIQTGPTFQLEYNTRETYGPAINWPQEAPLNATFWHKVTEAMEKNRTLVSIQNSLQGRLSVKTPNCTSEECTSAKICYMRSANVALGKNCKQGYSSVQGPFWPGVADYEDFPDFY